MRAHLAHCSVPRLFSLTYYYVLRSFHISYWSTQFCPCIYSINTGSIPPVNTLEVKINNNLILSKIVLISVKYSVTNSSLSLRFSQFYHLKSCVLENPH